MPLPAPVRSPLRRIATDALALACATVALSACGSAGGSSGGSGGQADLGAGGSSGVGGAGASGEGGVAVGGSGGSSGGSGGGSSGGSGGLSGGHGGSPGGSGGHGGSPGGSGGHGGSPGGSGGHGGSSGGSGGHGGSSGGSGGASGGSGGSPLPPDDVAAFCAATCSDLAACLGPDGAEGAADVCAAGCRERSGPEDRACLRAAGADCDALRACVSPAADPPDPDVADACDRACASLVGCAAEASGGDAPPEALADCRAVCLDRSTPDERACVLAAPGDCATQVACMVQAPPVDEALGAACDAACAGLAACLEPPLPDNVEGDCAGACVASATQDALDCVTAAMGDCAAMQGCFAGEAPPVDPAVRAACDTACVGLISCAGAVVPPDASAECAATCEARSTPAERDCLSGAGADCAALQACLAPGVAPDPDVLDDCAVTCAALVPCQSPESPDGAVEACTAGCAESSTEAERDCATGALDDCAALTTCLEPPGGPP